jgi:hypothetical protein
MGLFTPSKANIAKYEYAKQDPRFKVLLDHDEGLRSYYQNLNDSFEGIPAVKKLAEKGGVTKQLNNLKTRLRGRGAKPFIPKPKTTAIKAPGKLAQRLSALKVAGPALQLGGSLYDAGVAYAEPVLIKQRNDLIRQQMADQMVNKDVLGVLGSIARYAGWHPTDVADTHRAISSGEGSDWQKAKLHGASALGTVYAPITNAFQMIGSELGYSPDRERQENTYNKLTTEGLAPIQTPKENKLQRYKQFVQKYKARQARAAKYKQFVQKYYNKTT